MVFVLRMAGREMRAAWRRLLFFFLCVAVGVGAIVALRSIIQSVRSAFNAEARTLTAADIAIQTNRPWEPSATRILDRRLAAAGIEGRTESIETTTMVRPADDSSAITRMVELRGVEAAFPFYGQMQLEGGTRYSHALLEGHGALVRRELLTQLDLEVGDHIVIGQDPYQIRGVIETEPGSRLGAFSFGPRVLIDLAALKRSGLLAFGSRVRYEILLRVPEAQIDRLVGELEGDFRDQYVNVRTFRGRNESIDEDLERAEDYLSLVGFVILILGGIGVWSVTRVFVQQKLRSIAVLKCVGSTSSQVLWIYIVQVMLLGAGGSLLGVGLAAAAIAAVPPAVSGSFGAISYGLTTSGVVQGVTVGLLVSLLFALVPLMEVRHVKPLLLLRNDRPPVVVRSLNGWRERLRRVRTETDWARVAAIVAVSAALVATASWQAASLEAGLSVCAGFAGVALVLHLTGLGLVRMVRPLASSRSFALRHAVMSLSRPGNQTRVILLAVGLGSFFVIGVRGLQTSLLRELSLDLRPDAPDMYLLDVQQDQAEPLRAFFASANADRDFRLIPILRARVTGVSGREVNLESFEDVRGRGSLGREYVITFRDRLEANEELVDGVFWGQSDADAGPQVSIEESIRERFRINIGDVVRFDVLGRVVNARVTSVREVEWDDARSGGFMFVFNPAALAQAPHSYIGVARAPSDVTARARLQRDLVTRFSNVSVIDVREVLRTVGRVIANVTLAISIVGLIALFSGALILAGAVAMTKFQRLYETAILKTLGATTRTIAAMVLLEYGTLGVLAGTIGSVASLGLTWGLTTYLLEIPWRPAALENLGGIALTAAMVASVGVGASLDVLRRKPLATLRAE
jgi:putative ABC transport system permease protein